MCESVARMEKIRNSNNNNDNDNDNDILGVYYPLFCKIYLYALFFF